MSVSTSIGSVIGVLVMGLALVFYLVFYTDSNFFPINFARQVIYKCNPTTVANDEDGKVLDNPIRNGNFDYKGDVPFPGQNGPTAIKDWVSTGQANFAFLAKSPHQVSSGSTGEASLSSVNGDYFAVLPLRNDLMQGICPKQPFQKYLLRILIATGPVSQEEDPRCEVFVNRKKISTFVVEDAIGVEGGLTEGFGWCETTFSANGQNKANVVIKNASKQVAGKLTNLYIDSVEAIPIEEGGEDGQAFMLFK
tara:strand:- start:71 stop:823 length:753 start_codon:yes stop_codon:yes gene_type:complete